MKLFDLTDEQGVILVKLARQVMESHLDENVYPETQVNDVTLNEKCGVFVTLSLHEGNYGLRGCIGVPYPVKPLIEAVVKAAQSAAFHDPRFPPLQASELSTVVIEVSVLTPPEVIQVTNRDSLVEQVKVGRDGLIVERNWSKGLLLPQVAVDWGWDSAEFLNQCCVKAGLPENSWLEPDTLVYRFQAILFKEEEPEGKVIRRIIEGE